VCTAHDLGGFRLSEIAATAGIAGRSTHRHRPGRSWLRSSSEKTAGPNPTKSRYTGRCQEGPIGELLDFPRPGHGGAFPLAGGRHTVAGSQIWSGFPAPPGGRDAAALPGARSPGTVTIARSAASSIRSRRSISSPRYRTSDASSAVLRGRIRAQNAARLRMSVRRLLIAARVATWGIPRHLSASRRPSGQAGRPGGLSGVVHRQSPRGSDHRYRFVLRGLRLLRVLREV